MAGGTIFPAIIRPTYDPSAGFPKMVQDAQSSAGQIKQIFDTSFADIGKLAKSALTLPRNTNGSLNLPIEEYRKAARESDNYAKALRDIATAADAARKSQGDNSAVTAAYVAGARAAATEEEKRAVGLREQIGLYQKLQTELAKVNSTQAARPDFRSGAQKLLAGDTSVDQAAIAGASLQSVMGRIAAASGKASGELAKVKAEANAISAAAAERLAAEVAQAAASLASLSTQAKNAAEAGRLLNAVYAGTGEEFGRAAKSASESAAIFERAFAASKKYAADLELVKRAIDPTRVAQQQLDQELARADTAFEQGAISAREYGLAVNAAANNFERATVGGTNFGNTARQMSSHLGNLRIATLQAGQQLQDIGISLVSGQRAGIVFAQQLPQLAFALSYLEGSSNKTHAAIGRLGTFLSGPWGLAVGLAVGVLAQLTAGLFGNSEETDKNKKSHETLKEQLDRTKHSYEEVNAALADYNAQQKKSNETTLEGAQAAAEAAKNNIDEAISIRKKLAAQIEAYEYSASHNFFGQAGTTANAVQGLSLYSAKDANDKALVDLTAAAHSAIQQVGQELGNLDSDPVKRLHEGFAILKANASGSAEAVRELARAENAAVKAAQASARSSGGGAGSANALGGMTALLDQMGFTVAHTTDHSKYVKGTRRLSEHGLGRAIDFVPKGGMGQYTKAEVEQMLTDAGVKFSYGSTGVKQFFGPGDKGHSDHFHVGFTGAPNPESAGKAAEIAANATQRLAEYGRDAADKIASLKNNFDETPPAVARANDMLAKMSDLADDIEKKKPPNYQQLLADIAALKPVIENSVNKPFNDLLKASDEQRQVDELILAGHRDDAEVRARQLALEKQMGPLSAQQLADLHNMVVQDRLRSRELEKQNEAQQRQLSLIAQTKDNISHTFYDLFKGGGLDAIAGGFARQWDAMLQNMADSLTETLFGDFFRDRKDEVLGFDRVKEASTETAKNLDILTEAVAGAAQSLEQNFDQTFAKPGAANDNAPNSFSEIVVTGQRAAAKEIRAALGSGLQAILGKQLYDKIGNAVPTALQGAAFGQLGGGLVGNAGVGSAIGGVIGQAGGKALGKALGSTLGKFASVLGPLGGILGGVLGGLLGGAKTGSASVSNGTITSGGNNATAKAQSNSQATTVQSGINQIVDALGGTLGNYGFTIGQRNGEFRVSGNTGADVTSKNPSNLLYKGKDEGEAVRVALVNAIQDGAVKGIREGARRLLLAGQDLNAQLAKALKFQNVFDELDAIKDPVGAAVRKLNKEFTSLQGIFKEAGASTEEYAALEELYGLKRADVIKQQTEATKQANEQMASSLKDLISQLETGDSGLSLRDRLSNARATYDPLAEAIRGGQTVDYAKFTDAARNVIDITRQIYGSQQEYFNTFNDVLGLSKQALAQVGANVTTIDQSGLPGSPFTASTAANDNASLTAALGQLGLSIAGGASLADLQAQLAALNNNIGTLIQIGLANGTITPTTYIPVANNF